MTTCDLNHHILSQIMNSPPIPGPKPKSALPAYLLNGGLRPQTSTRARERENLTSSIQSTYGRRATVNLADEQSSAASRPWIDKQDDPPITNGVSQVLLKEAARDPRDEATPPTPPVSASPYTLNPPIDFDGLSWPSKHVILLAFPIHAHRSHPFRCRNAGTSRVNT
jgi:GTP cyclohydrolase I